MWRGYHKGDRLGEGVKWETSEQRGGGTPAVEATSSAGSGPPTLEAWLVGWLF